MVSWVGLALTFRKRYDAFKSVDISDGIVNPIYRYGVEITPDDNPLGWKGLVLGIPKLYHMLKVGGGWGGGWLDSAKI